MARIRKVCPNEASVAVGTIAYEEAHTKRAYSDKRAYREYRLPHNNGEEIVYGFNMFYDEHTVAKYKLPWPKLPDAEYSSCDEAMHCAIYRMSGICGELESISKTSDDERVRNKNYYILVDDGLNQVHAIAIDKNSESEKLLLSKIGGTPAFYGRATMPHTIYTADGCKLPDAESVVGFDIRGYDKPKQKFEKEQNQYQANKCMDEKPVLKPKHKPSELFPPVEIYPAPERDNGPELGLW